MKKPRLLLAAAIILSTAFLAQSRIRVLQIRTTDEGGIVHPSIFFQLGEVDEITITPYDDTSTTNSTTNEVNIADKKSLNQVSPRLYIPEWESMKIFNDAEEVKSIPLQNINIEFKFRDEYLALQFWDAKTSYNAGYEEFLYESFTRLVLDSGMGSITGASSSPQDISVVYDQATEELKIVSSENLHAVRVYNMQGVCVRNADAREIAESQSLSMNGLSSGIYVTEVVSENGVITSKIAKR